MSSPIARAADPQLDDEHGGEGRGGAAQEVLDEVGQAHRREYHQG